MPRSNESHRKYTGRLPGAPHKPLQLRSQNLKRPSSLNSVKLLVTVATKRGRRVGQKGEEICSNGRNEKSLIHDRKQEREGYLQIIHRPKYCPPCDSLLFSQILTLITDQGGCDKAAIFHWFWNPSITGSQR